MFSLISALSTPIASLNPSLEEPGALDKTIQMIATGILAGLAILYVIRKTGRRETEPRQLPTHIKTPQSKDIPFNSPCILNTTQVLSLSIDRCGLSDNPHFRNSYFEIEFLKEKGYRIVRRPWKPVNRVFPICGQTNEISFPSWFGLEKLMKKNDVPVYVIERLPKKILGFGAGGHVYDLSGTLDNSVIKIDKMFSQSEPMTISSDMILSFNHSLGNARALRKLPGDPRVLRCKGIMRVIESNQWGVVYEKIETECTYLHHLANICEMAAPLPRIFSFMRNLALGLQLLDRYGCSQTDLKEENILIRKNGLPVIIDLSKKTPSIASRQQFGALLNKAVGDFDDVSNLVHACSSNQSMEEFGWDDVLDALNKAALSSALT